MIETALLYQAYREGAFPMAEGAHEADPIHWYCPDMRAVLLPHDFHVPRRLRRWLRHSGFTVRWQDDFRIVMQACAGQREDGTWINPPMVDAFEALAHEGRAYCLSVWQNGQRVGGIYGVCLGRILTAESMFSRVSNASSAALVVLMRAAALAGIALVDIQMPNEHTRRFKPMVIPHDAYIAALYQGRDMPCMMDDGYVYSAASELLADALPSTQSFNQTS